MKIREHLNEINSGDEGLQYFNYLEKNFHLCTPNDIQMEALTVGKTIRCFQSKIDIPKQIAIIGDSHAEHLFLGLAEELNEKNIVYYTKGSLPIINSDAYKKIFNSVINDSNITTVILAAYWNVQKAQIPNEESFKNEIVETIKNLTLANKKVYLVEDVPSFSFDSEKCKYERLISKSNKCTEKVTYFYKQYQMINPVFQNIWDNNPTFTILKTAKYFCNNEICSMAKNGNVLYRNKDHLNIIGSKYLAKHIVFENPELAN